MLRIGFDGRALASPAAGMRRYSRELFGALAQYDPSLTVVAVGAPPEITVPMGIERAAGARALPTNLGWMLTGLPRAARRAHVDLFHAPSYTAPVYGPRPLVLTIHDVSYERNPEWYPYKRDPIRRGFYRASARSADRVITDSAFSKREIADVYGLRPEKVDVVPLAASSTFTAGSALPLPPGYPSLYCVHVGDLHVRRNLPMLVRAVAAVRWRRTAWSSLGLVLVGVDRGTGAELAQLSATLGGVVPIVTFVDRASDDALVALYRSAVALTYPSRYEGFGLPLLEAMACGTPVIAARTSSIPEVVGDAGLLLEPDDQSGWEVEIERVLDDPAHRQRLRDAGIHRAREFSWRRTAEQTAIVYRSLVGAKR